MDVEAIGKVNGGYKAAEPVKATVSKPDVAVASSKVVTESAAQAVAQSGKTGDQGKGDGTGKKGRMPSEATFNEAVHSANRKMEHTRCEYSYHKDTNRVSIKVINDDTDEVIREIPPEKSLDMLQKMWEMAGILVDEKR